MLMRVKTVEYVSDYKLKLLFSDGKTKVVDFEEWIRRRFGIFDSFERY